MMKSYRELTIRDTAPEGLLNTLWAAQLPFHVVELVDPVTICLRVDYEDLQTLQAVLQPRGGEVLRCTNHGPRRYRHRLPFRLGLVVCGVVCALLLAVSNLFVWRIEVQGTDRVPAGAVLRAMEDCGAGIGSFWPAFDGERLRSQLLLRLPELQWVGVNYASGAVRVTVREQREPPEVVDNDDPVHVVADREGVLTSLEVKHGQPAAAVGQAVEQGQLLISGAAKSTMGTTRPVHALGTAEARTRRTLTVQQPLTLVKKDYTGRKSTKISLILWGKRLNFYLGSSFSRGTCDKIILDYHLCMGDVLSLPVQVVVQRCVYRDAWEQEGEPERQVRLAKDTLMDALQQSLGEDGKVLTADYAALPRKDTVTVTLAAECSEQIGREVPMSDEELQQIRMENDAGEENDE